MKKSVQAATLATFLVGLGCGGQYRNVGPHIPERAAPTIDSALAELPDQVTKLADPKIDQTFEKLFKTYGGAANRVAEYCLNKAVSHDNDCPAINHPISPLQFWEIADINDSTDYAWGGTDENGARKCNVVLLACLKQELVNPVSLGAEPVTSTNSIMASPAVPLPEIHLSFSIPDLPVIFARNDALMNPVKGNVRIQECLNLAADKLDPDAQKIFNSAKLKAGSQDLFWLYPKFTQSGVSTGEYLLGEDNTRIFANNFKDCLDR